MKLMHALLTLAVVLSLTAAVIVFGGIDFMKDIKNLIHLILAVIFALLAVGVAVFWKVI